MLVRAPTERRAILNLFAAYRPDLSTIRTDEVGRALRQSGASLWSIDVVASTGWQVTQGAPRPTATPGGNLGVPATIAPDPTQPSSGAYASQPREVVISEGGVRSGGMRLTVTAPTQLLPALARSKENSRRVNCLSNLRQMGIAAQLYTEDHDGSYPIAYQESVRDGVKYSVAWDFATTLTREARVEAGLLWRGVGVSKIQQCPSYRGKSNWGSDPHSGYNYNASYIGHGQFETIPEPARVGDVRQPAGTVILPMPEVKKAAWLERARDGAKIFGLPLTLPPRVLLLGAGPDTLPVVDFASRLGWKVTLVDHRPAYAQASRFPAADRVVQTRPDELASAVDLRGFTAAVVMSHHLPSDLAYLLALAKTEIPYVGLLGPAIRREKLLSDMGDEAASLRPRLRAPVGLALGGRAPESIALAIIAEIHAFVHGSEGGPFSNSAG